ncbi:MAG TPA: amidophosphoribosyltransferase [Lachnospiraceae bacterium]|nr:amidophosphoribosyltransferase [Lachnospiraceae bacterium]
MSGKLHEECGVFGVSTHLDEAAGITYNGLLAMQHRGQEGAGIAVIKGNAILYHKNTGLVNEVFSKDVMEKMPKSNLAVGHVRYSTTGSNTIHNVQPFITEFLTGRLATVHNGNVINAKEIKHHLETCGLDFSATSDSEVISSLIAYKTVKEGSVEEGVVEAAKKLKGAFSLIVLSGTHKIVAIRDANGFRPLCIGKNEYGMAVASESCALDSCGFRLIRDIKPGEMVVIEDGKIIEERICLPKANEGICIFEYVYFARPDSVIDHLSVYEARHHMGRILAREHPVDADIVCGVPDSGLEAAEGYAAESGIKLASGFVKNRYIGRSFIFPTQTQRENAVKLKLNPLGFNIAGKKIVVVDDSIVRGTTSAKLIQNLRNAGAREVHMRISSPPFKHTCHFGTDIDREDNLIANRMSVEEIREQIGADTLGYISIGGLKEACKKCNMNFCTGCFTGDYNIEVGDYLKSDLES